MHYNEPNLVCYRVAQAVAWFVSALIFKRKILRNEIKGKQGSFVVIANHETALDFVNLISAAKRPMTFVISQSFFKTLPIRGFLKKMGVIPKQQFQTTAKNMKQMKTVVDHGGALVIYPAGLMCEDGRSTPVPRATYKFLKWLGVDVYMAKATGTYFVMPKWAKGIRPGRTYMDIYRLFSKEELSQLTMDQIRGRTDEALLFDAYREQEDHRIKYAGNRNIAGLENVLYMCPHCKSEFSMAVKEASTIYCAECGFEAVSDEYAFLHSRQGSLNVPRYVSDWSKLIYDELKERIRQGREQTLTGKTRVHMVDDQKKKFIDVGYGTVSLSRDRFQINGMIHGDAVELSIPIAGTPALPFSPGKHFEIQHGGVSYRCVPEDGRLVMKYINMLKIFYELNLSDA